MPDVPSRSALTALNNALLLGAASVTLAACAMQQHQNAAREQMREDVTQSLYKSAPQDAQSPLTQSTQEDERVKVRGFVRQTQPGARASTRTLGRSDGAGVQNGAGGAVSLNFANADLASVVDTILGEQLGENYAIDSELEGTVTLQTNQPLNRGQLLSTLQELLSLHGAQLIAGDGLYKVVSDSRSKRTGDLSLSSAISRGLSVRATPLAHASAAGVAKMLASFAPASGRIDADEERNMIFSIATPAEQRSIAEVIAVLDQDYLSNMAFALEPLEDARASSLVDELNVITRQPGGQEGAGPLRFLAIDRMNAVLVMAKSNTALAEGRAWIKRLDQGAGDGQQLFVYPVKNRRAEELAQIVGKVFAVQALVQAAPAGGLAPGQDGTTLQTGGVGGAGETPQQPIGLGQQGFGGNAPFSSGENDNGIRIVADNSTNALIVYADYAAYRPIKAALDKLDVLPVQVLIEATLIEVSLSNGLEFGVRWFFQNGDSTFDFSDLDGGLTNPVSPGFNYVLDTSDVRFVLSALRQVTDVEFLSSPNMMVLDNQIARLQVGDEVPIQTRSAINTIDPNAPVVNDIEYRNTGVILSVRPKVTSDGLVVMDISQEVSDVVRTLTSDIVSPTIQQRRFDSTVAVASGETVILGGLTSRNSTLGRTGLPVLSSIPLIGNAFTSRSNLRTRTELLVMITPRVIRDRNAARLATNEMRAKLAEMFVDKPDQAARMVNPMRTLGKTRDIIEESPLEGMLVPAPIARPQQPPLALAAQPTSGE
ncbi:MAG: type II secretion system secretin GspD [Pseudomonadota bacterium]